MYFKAYWILQLDYLCYTMCQYEDIHPILQYVYTKNFFLKAYNNVDFHIDNVNNIYSIA